MKKSTTAKFVAGFVGIALALSFVVTPVTASAATIAELQAMIASLQQQLSAMGSTPATGSYTFSTNLTIGSKGADVMNLQKVLNMDAATQVAATGPGSKGMETSTFGPMTKAAVIKFQTKYGISPAAGYVGALTRAKLNTMGGTVVVTPPGTLPTGGALTVTAGTQTANSLAPKSASRVPFTALTLTAGSADVTVNSITVQRSGLAQDAVFAGVVLLNSDGMQIGIAKTLNSNHQAMVGEPFVVKAGTSMMLTVAGNMASDLSSYTGQIAGLDVVAVNTTATVSGSLPITGAQQTVNNSLTIGTATINTSSFDPNTTSASQPIGTTAYRFSGLKVTAGSAEDMTLKSIRWNQTGSVGSTDLANLMTYVNGTAYPVVVSADGKYYSTVFPSGIVITKGNSVEVYIQGDLVGSGSAGRTVEFDIYKNTDLYLVGNTYSYGITAPIGSGSVSSTAGHATTINTSSNPWFQGSQLSITAGSVTTIGKASEVKSQNIAINVSNQVLGGFATNFSGEPISVQNLKFLISTSSTAGTTANSPYSAITSITLVDENGAVVAGPVDAVVGDGSTTYGGQASLATSYAGVRFTDTVTFPVGRHVYTLKGKIPSGWAGGTTVNIFLKPSTDWTSVTGQTTGNSVSLSGQSTAFSMNQMTVKAAALTVSISAQPTSQTIVAGVQGVTLANFVLDATASGEDVRMSSFPVKFTDSTLVDVSGCQLYNAAAPTVALNTGSRVVNFTTAQSATVVTVSLDNSLVVPKGTTVTLTFKCNIATGSTNSVQANYVTAGDFSVTGQVSGNAVTPTVNANNGATFTISSGSLAISVDASSPSYAVIAGGTAGVKVGVIKLRATNEDMVLTKLGLKVSSGTSADVVGATLKSASGTTLGTFSFPQGATPTATSTLTTTLNLPKDTDVLVNVYADFASIGSSQSGTQGILVKVDPLNVEATGDSSGTTVGASQTSSVAGVRTFRSYPSLVLDTLSSTGIGDGKLMRFKVTANGAGAVGVQQFKFTLATTTLSMTNIGLFAYTDASYGTAISGQGTSGQIGSNASVGSTVGGVSTFTITPTTNPVQVTGTIYFELRGSISANATGASAVTTLVGDSAYPAWLPQTLTSPATTYYVATSSPVTTNHAFVWSGNATTTSATNDVDWSNGYGLSGFPSAGLIQSRSY